MYERIKPWMEGRLTSLRLMRALRERKWMGGGATGILLYLPHFVSQKKKKNSKDKNISVCQILVKRAWALVILSCVLLCVLEIVH